ncbi:MAG: DUF4160 domain-containing protein [Bdellovibrionales bacterium]
MPNALLLSKILTGLKLTGNGCLININIVNPTLFIYKNYRFFFFSREESRMHVHVSCDDGEAKFWIEPVVALADHHELSVKKINELKKVVEEKSGEIAKAWKKHFKRS